ncbi:DNRLRE domain-containing protein [Actinoallomurus soli]|uniref:DNRLRE domain-containing protein n=1 Tax=Actinoallomurus soli TaxID=2952535 RepID=UPI002093EA51|nr:DNRLRE domain-containing protein [Actinoallomurus soli]MCO5969137.1 DNRLRE domain-containing protein [Actinoallomurus soli]
MVTVTVVAVTGSERASAGERSPSRDPRTVASQTAKARGTKVEVQDDRTDNSTTWANPDGTFTMESFSGPVRVNKDGTWRSIDTSLTPNSAATELRPKTAAADIQLSDGGAGPFATLQRANRSFSVAWRDSLPSPRVQGDTAIYEDVVPDGDLVVKALPNGFSHSLVLRKQPKQDLEIPLSVDTEGLTLAASSEHGLDLRDSSGRLVASAPEPRMWDSGTDPRSGEPSHQAAVDTTIQQTADGPVLRLKPDARFLADPAVRYPVTIDPTSTLTVQTDTWVQTDFPDSQRGSTELKAGTYDGTHIARSYLRFNHVDDLRGTQIIDADLRLWAFWSSVCKDPSAGVQARRVTSTWDPDTIRYGSEPNTTTTGAVTSVAAPGAASCPQDFMHWNVGTIVKAWADGQPDYGIQLRGADEKDPSTWRRFYSSNYVAGAQGEKEPALSVTFNYRLPTPTNVGASPKASDLTTSPTVASTRPTLSAQITEPNGKPVDYTFEVAKSAGRTTVVTGSANAVASGATATWQVPDGRLKNPGSYIFRVRAMSATGAGGWSAWQPLITDAAQTPQSLATGTDESGSTVLSGVLSRPSGAEVGAHFYLYDTSGAVIGGTPLGQGSVQSGQRMSLRVPAGLTKPGQSYRWQMDACVKEVCTPKTPSIAFTAPQPRSSTGTQRVTIAKNKMTIRTAQSDPAACGGAACPLTADDAVRVGGAGTAQRVTHLKVDLDALPAGARITAASLNLGAPDCGAGCPSSGSVSGEQPESDLADNATGADAAEVAVRDPDAPPTSIADPQVDITGLAGIWYQDSSQNSGIILEADGSDLPVLSYGNGSSSINVTIDYLPPTPPGKVSNISTRGGDGGVLVSWAAPQDVGASTSPGTGADDDPMASPISSYDVQALDGNNNVVQSKTVVNEATIVSGLANGTSYHFQVRAHSKYGDGPWLTTPAVAPAGIPGDKAAYVDAVKQLVQGREAITEGRFSDADAVLAASPDADYFGAALKAQSADLVAGRDDAAQEQLTQADSTITFPEIFASYSPSNDAVTIRAAYEGQEVFVNNAGTAAESKVTNDFSRESDFVFNRPLINAQGDADEPAPVLASETDSSAIDTQVDGGGEINAFTPEQLTASVTPKAASGSDLDKASLRAAAKVDHPGIARWAVNHAKSEKAEYKYDCTNFVSKALNRGGHIPMRTGWYRSDRSWWDNWLNASYPWAAADHHKKHFATAWDGKKPRVYWERNYGEVELGDAIYFERPAGTPVHMAIVSYKAASSIGGIYFAQHNRAKGHQHYDTYKPLSLVYGNYRNIGFGYIWK